MSQIAQRSTTRQRPVARRALTVVHGLEEQAAQAAVRMALQPVVDLSRREVVGYEALARFGTSGSRLPSSVFAEAERQGRATELEAVLLHEALACRSSVPDQQWLAVNVSQPALLTSAVDRVLREAGPLGGVVLELTEQVLVPDVRSLRRKLDEHRDAGALVALDHVGSGHSGLRQLLEIHPDIVKLDRSLVSGVAADDDRQTMVSALLSLCDGMGSVLLAEGVETLEDLACLAALGVVWVQGYLLGRPSLRRHDLAPAGRDAIAALPPAVLARRTGAPPTAVAAFTTRFGAALALTGHHLGGAVVVDATGVAVELLVPCPDGGVPVSCRPLLASAGTPPQELLSLALDRPRADRSAPIVLLGTDAVPTRVLSMTTLMDDVLT